MHNSFTPDPEISLMARCLNIIGYAPQQQHALCDLCLDIETLVNLSIQSCPS